MFGIIDTRFRNKKAIGVLRGKSMSVENAIEKRKVILSHLEEYERQEIAVNDLGITRIIGTIKLGDTVEYNQTTGLNVVFT